MAIGYLVGIQFFFGAILFGEQAMLGFMVQSAITFFITFASMASFNGIVLAGINIFVVFSHLRHFNTNRYRWIGFGLLVFVSLMMLGVAIYQQRISYLS